MLSGKRLARPHEGSAGGGPSPIEVAGCHPIPGQFQAEANAKAPAQPVLVVFTVQYTFPLAQVRPRSIKLLPGHMNGRQVDMSVGFGFRRIRFLSGEDALLVES